MEQLTLFDWPQASLGSDCPFCHSHDTWFDRELCPEPCGQMHTRCGQCGWAIDGCPLEAK